MVDVRIPVVETERLLLRAPTPADASAWADCLEADADLLKYVPARSGPAQERADRFVRNYLRRWQESPIGMGWSVVLKAEGTFIGFGGVDAASETDGEIEYFIVKPHQRRGYASEVARAMTDHWFRTTSGDRLLAYVIPENVGSVRAVEKLGYRRMRSVNYLELMGNPSDIVLETPDADEWTLTRDEWSARAKDERSSVRD